ncbi:hypothetical protein UFOVP923_49 [uncultured Caudovirales phage]|uniref:Uncharacterized protein n=1 Tax=uncultured Caudovirales phage TaxID=2100421 RepID=A0A6J5PQ16_9CAUD|nr:hypothetical protein UFOVP923_49 [uncultured Caudovirales phage]
MAAKKKPAISLGPISDDLGRIIAKALSGAQGVLKQTQAKKVASKLKDKAGYMQPKGNPARAAIDKAATKGEKLRVQIGRSNAKKAQMGMTSEMAEKHMKSMKSQGKNWDGSVNKPAAAGAKKNAKAGKENTKLSAAFVQKAKDDKIVSSYSKQIARGEVMGKRATGRYESTTGRVKYVGKDAAKAAGKESTGIEKGMAKRARTDGQKNVDLKKAVANAKTPEAKREARKVLRAHQDRTGFR